MVEDGGIRLINKPFAFLPPPNNVRFAHIQMIEVYLQIAVAVTVGVIEFDTAENPVLIVKMCIRDR